MKLPIDEVLPEVLAHLETHSNLILTAAPGSGKTTRVAPYLLKHGLPGMDHPEIILLQPRRIATRAMAARIAEENNWKLGEEVGYQVRFENRTGPRTRLKIMTEGVLARLLQHDPSLEKVGIVILDEFHERSLHTDVAISMLRELQLSVRPDLKIIVMSATLDAKAVASFLGDCATINSDTRLFPVDIRHLSKPIAWNEFHELTRTTAQAVKTMVSEKQALMSPDHVLVFLPGVSEIGRVSSLLETWANEQNMQLLPLHGRLGSEEQDRVLRPSSSRKIILSTNIAETSLTIDGVATVVDSGLARVNRADWQLGIERLELNRISRSSATQRAGRAGRQSAGRCLRLWTSHDEKTFPDSHEAEIKRVNLADTLLFLADQGISDFLKFPWFEPPPGPSLQFSLQLLWDLGALKKGTGQISALGRKMLQWPLSARLSRLMYAADESGCIREGATLAALLSERDILRPGFRGGDQTTLESDLFLRLDAYQDFENRHGDSEIDFQAARNVSRIKDQLISQHRSTAGKTPKKIVPTPEQLSQLLLKAFPDRLTRRRGPNDRRGLMVGGRGVVLDAHSVVRQALLFLTLDAQETRRDGHREILARLVSAVGIDLLKATFPGEVHESTRTFFDEHSKRVQTLTALEFRGLALEEGRKTNSDPEEAARLLTDVILDDEQRYLHPIPAFADWARRYRFAQEYLKDLEWPHLREDLLKPGLVDASYGSTSLEEVLGKNLAMFIETRLPKNLLRILEQEVPTHLTVPSGSRIAITYEAGKSAVVAVRLQEIFGWRSTPRICQGQIPITLELLSPGFKPVQTTSDLESFWKSTYHEIRKELRARYPKHSWPEDPHSAKPVAKGGVRR